MERRRARPHRRTDRRIELSRQICELYAQGHYTIASCCAVFNVKYSTFQYWAQPKLAKDDLLIGKHRKGFVHEVHDLYKRATIESKENFLRELKAAVRRGLLLRVGGLHYTETVTQVNFSPLGQPESTTISSKDIYIPPDTLALIFATNNAS